MISFSFHLMENWFLWVIKNLVLLLDFLSCERHLFFFVARETPAEWRSFCRCVSFWNFPNTLTDNALLFLFNWKSGYRPLPSYFPKYQATNSGTLNFSKNGLKFCFSKVHSHWRVNILVSILYPSNSVEK